MTEVQQPAAVPWAQWREAILTAREIRRKAAVEAERRCVDGHPMINGRLRCKAVIEARLQLREDLLSARFAFRRTVLRSRSRSVSTP